MNIQRRDIDGISITDAITDDDLIAAVEGEMFGLENPGFCIVCGLEHDGCEPDARKYPCEDGCGNTVYGAAEILLYLVI